MPDTLIAELAPTTASQPLRPPTVRQPVIVERPACPLIGLSIVTTLRAAIEEGTVKRMGEEFAARRAEIPGQVDDTTLLVQLYPPTCAFNDTTPCTVMLGAPVTSLDCVPEGMTGHTIPAGEYCKATHIGPECELGQTYGYLYGPWLEAAGRQPAGHDFEVFDARYQPESPANEIDLHVALR